MLNVLAALALSFASIAQEPPVLETPQASRSSNLPFPGALPLDAAGRPTVIVTCVLDATTSRPIAGARLIAVFEATYPLPGVWWSTRTAVSDADGWVRMNVEDLEGSSKGVADPVFYVEAPGYAPSIHYGMRVGPSVRLELGEQVEVWVRDELDRPIKGAQLGWLLGCGHMPDLRVVHTDERGRATLKGVDRGMGELWPVASGFLSDYSISLESANAVVRLPKAPVVRGRVVDANGKSQPGLYVGTSLFHRGPWTRTDAEGRFELVGLRAGSPIRVHDASVGNAALASFDDTPTDGRAMQIVVPYEPEPVVALVSIALSDASGGDAPEALSVTATRVSDGFVWRALSDDSGVVELSLPAGAFEIMAGGDLSGFDAADANLELVVDRVQDEAVEIELTLTPSRRIRVDASALPADAEIVLVGEFMERTIDPSEPFAVPRTGPAGLRVEVGDRVWAKVLDEAQRVEGTVIELEAPQPVEFTITFTTPTGEPARGWAVLRDETRLDERQLIELRSVDDSMETAAVAVWSIGPTTLWLIPENSAFAPRRLVIDTPVEPGSFDLGEIPFADRNAPSLTFLEADGSPYRPDRVELRRRGELHILELDDQGRVPPGTFEPLPSDSVRVESEGLLPFAVELTGPGPWTITRPMASIAFEVADDEGNPVPAFALWIDGDLFESPTSAATLVALAPGTHRIVLSAPGYSSVLVDIDLAENEQRALRAVLPVRR